ncbi:hypothetical protein ASZ78_004579 [Callipepla squamata]|uniref:SAM domain-containing protein n=1 Tax=Callipepla squamata TaxID=9009 RepID=A0A226N2R0_CALSU|nr:hypothetical protein ASZ78_004579 [Callipepla squamata]
MLPGWSTALGPSAGEQPQEERQRWKQRPQELPGSWAAAVLDSCSMCTSAACEILMLDVGHRAFSSELTANTFLVLAVCIYLNKNGSAGPHLDKKKIQRLPDHFGPARASVVLQQAVQACIDCAYHQKTVFSFLKQGHGGEVISAVFDREQHTLNLPAVNSITYVLRFLEKLCHNLRSDNLFGNQPFSQHSHAPRSHQYDHDRYLPGETFVLGDGAPGPLEPRLDPMDSALNAVNASSHSRSSREFRLQGYRHLHQPCSLSQGSSSALGRLSSAGSERYRDGTRLSGRDPSCWTVEEVMQFIREADPQLGPHADLFRKHVSVCETFVLGDGAPGPLEPRLDPMDSALNAVNASSHSRSSREFRLQGYRHLHQPCSLSQGSSSALGRLSSAGSERYRDGTRLSGRDPSCWTVEEVMQFIREADPQLGPHADLFRKHEIDGKALLLLRSDMMMKYMGLKLGPALKLTYHIDKLKQGKF